MPFVDRALDHDLLVRSVGTMYVDPEGGPVRTILNGRHRKPTGSYCSWKNDRSMPWEAKVERAAFWLAEVDADVVSYLAQPHALEIDVGERRPLVFYPDLRRDRLCGKVSITEYKGATDRRKDDPGYLEKIELARQIYVGIGWSFELVHEHEMPVAAIRNAQVLQLYGDVRVPTALHLAAVDGIRDAGGVLPRGKVEELLGGGLRSQAYLSSLVVARVLRVDPYLRLNRNTPVELALARGARS